MGLAAFIDAEEKERDCDGVLFVVREELARWTCPISLAKCIPYEGCHKPLIEVGESERDSDERARCDIEGSVEGAKLIPSEGCHAVFCDIVVNTGIFTLFSWSTFSGISLSPG
jgi:hypothetical protein